MQNVKMQKLLPTIAGADVKKNWTPCSLSFIAPLGFLLDPSINLIYPISNPVVSHPPSS
jgi:hypothetical protein